jgi:hypothetical protein
MRVMLLLATIGMACAPRDTDPVNHATQPLKTTTITVHAGARQTFVAYGTSYGTGGYGAITDPAVRAQAADMLWKELGLKILRLWYGPCSQAFDYAAAKSLFYSRYVKNGEIADAVSRNAELLLAPACGEGTIANIPQLAKNIAQLVADLKKEKGLDVATTGLANEPGGMSPAAVVQGVKLLRQELDARGLAGVRIIAPEWASADGAALQRIDALKGDAQAWQALHGVATHSYNMAATEEVAKRVIGTGKTYWQTESSDNGDEGPDNAVRAATTAARVLNDLNHMVTHWIWFIGWGTGGYYDGDGGTKLFVYDPSSGKLLKHLKYSYLLQLRQTLRPGALVRHCTSAGEGEMHYTYGLKPAINAAAAQNADGSWALGVVNDTGIPSSWSGTSWHPAETFEVTLDVAELAGAGDAPFKVMRSKKGKPLEDEGTLTMKGGKVKVTVAPLELVTLLGPSTSPPTAEDGGAAEGLPGDGKTPGDEGPADDGWAASEGASGTDRGAAAGDNGTAGDDDGQRAGLRGGSGCSAAGGEPPAAYLLLCLCFGLLALGRASREEAQQGRPSARNRPSDRTSSWRRPS